MSHTTLNVNMLAKDTRRTRETLRRNIRRAITGGNNIYAIVLGVYQNMAAVQVEHTNQKMYGLSIIGGDVSVGDRVILDYSHGTPPFVRSNYTTVGDKAETELGVFNENYTPEFNPSMDGLGWADNSLKYRYGNMTAGLEIWHINNPQIFLSGEPQKIRWGDNVDWFGSWYYAYLWDSQASNTPGGMWDYTNKQEEYGSTMIRLSKGKFLVRTYLLFPNPNVYTFHPQTHGWIKIEILQNGTPVAETTQRWGRVKTPQNDQVKHAHLTYWYYMQIGEATSCSCIVDGDYGDYVEVRLTQTVCDTEDFDSYWFAAVWYYLAFSATALPGTMSNVA